MQDVMMKVVIIKTYTTMAEDKNNKREIELDDELLDEVSGGAWTGDVPPAST